VQGPLCRQVIGPHAIDGLPLVVEVWDLYRLARLPWVGAPRGGEVAISIPIVGIQGRGVASSVHPVAVIGGEIKDGEGGVGSGRVAGSECHDGWMDYN
jgi:hypothetical protein